MKIEVFFDIETKKLFNEVESREAKDLGVSIVSLYRREIDDLYREVHGEMMSFWEKDFDRMWRLFQEADRVIGFNSKSFDFPALEPYALYPLDYSNHFDILEKVRAAIGRRVGLGVLAKDTLGNDKIDVGINAVNYWRRGDAESLAKLKKYCEADVIITRDLYDYGLAQKHLKFTDSWNALRQFPVDFAYPHARGDKGKQVGLF